MSWVFLAGDKVYKLKKPVRFPYLDFSTLERREAACAAEVQLNKRLASDVYLGVKPLVVTDSGLSIGGEGAIADWLVVMRRLDERHSLEHVLLNSQLTHVQLGRLIARLVTFYRSAKRVYTSVSAQRDQWRHSLDLNRRILLDPRLGMPVAQVRRIDRSQQLFLGHCADLIAQRARKRRILDAHGDLRPEHIWLTDGIKIIDCLEFNASLRAIDPFDEIAYLGVECERLGAPWVAEICYRGLARGLHDEPPHELYLFYRCHRAALRARLAIAHLLEPNPRTPEKWPVTARAYLDIAARDAGRLELLIRRPSVRSGAGPLASKQGRTQRAARPAKRRPSLAPPPAGGGMAAPRR